MIGVNFQPGATGDYGQQTGNGRPSAGSGIQEAIKILSLRLPRVLGAQPAASMPLLTSQGSGGNPRVDSIVNQVLSRVGMGQQPPMAMQPSRVGAGPSFGGTQNALPMPQSPWTGGTPRVIVDSPMGQPQRWPGQSQLDGGGGQPPSLFGELPPNFQAPTPPPQDPGFGEIGKRLGEYPNYGGYDQPSFGEPMF